MPRGCAITSLIAMSAIGAILALLGMTAIILNERDADLGQIARASRVVRPDDPGAPPDTPISVTGLLEIDDPGLGDDQFLVPGAYLQIERTVEMYAWEEYEARKDSDGDPVYQRRKVWTRSPSRLSSLRNPELTVQGTIVTAASARIGALLIDPRAADLPLREPVALHRELLLPNVAGTIHEDRLYIGKGTWERPQVGDVRVGYSAVPSGQLVTVFGALEGSRVVPYRVRDGQSLYDVIMGDRETALREFQAVQVLAGWLIRVFAAMLLWCGLLLLFWSSRRLVGWPQWLGITSGSLRLASVVGLALFVLAAGSLYLSGGSLLVLVATLLLAAGAAGAGLMRRRARVS